MVLQYKHKIEKRWRDYKGKEKLKGSVSKYGFRLLTKDKTKIFLKEVITKS